ncbi:MAG: GntR family transcriptional regulator [Actinomycetota bacterium]|nr:GntR family transcriptional regulator [Actinomycetota bacterium]
MTTPLFPGHRLPLRIDAGAPVPPFAQLRTQLSVLIAHGRLSPGERLPTIRELASQLDLAPGTVARAYRELERTGLAVTSGRRGTFVSDEPPNAEALMERDRRLHEAARTFAATIGHLGVDLDTAVDAVREAAAERDGDGS